MRIRRVDGRILWIEIQVKGPQERNRHKKRVKGVGKLGWFMSRTQTLTSPPREGEPAGTVDHEYTTIFDFCTYSREINGVFPDFTHTHTRTKLYHWLFHGHCPSEVFQTLQGYNLAWGLEV